MPGLIEDLEKLVAIPSVAFPGYPAEPVRARWPSRRCRCSGRRVHQRAADGGPSRLPADLRRDPWSGRLTGRDALRALRRPARPAGAGLDDRPVDPDPQRTAGSTAAAPPTTRAAWSTHLGTLRIFDGKPPCTVKLILEGMEETESNLEAFVEAHPELFDVRPVRRSATWATCASGEPVLTTALRGDVACIVTVRTLEHPLHSGVFGGAAPDAMMALARLLATLARRRGRRRRRGSHARRLGRRRTSAPRTSGPAPTCSTGVEPDRDRADRRPRSGPSPSINAIGIDMTSIAGSSNVLIPEATGEDLDADRPGFGAGHGARRPCQPPRDPRALGRPDRGAANQGRAPVPVQDRRTRLCRRAPGARGRLRQARRRGGLGRFHPACFAPSRRLRRARSSSSGVPRTSPPRASTASDESVDPSEIEKMVVAQALLVQLLAERD